MKRLSILGLAIALAIVLVALLTVSSKNTVSAVHYEAQPLQGGAPAIHPDPAMLQAHALPTYTSAEVDQYLQQNPFVGGKTTGGLKPAYTIAFLTQAQVATKIKAPIASNPGETASVLCYVEFQGPIVLTNAKIPFGPPPQVNYGYEIFDGSTGNALTWGGY